MISISHLSKQYHDLTVLQDICLDIPTGCIYGLAGQSGAGKSTLLRCINGLEPFQAGEITIDGKPVSVSSDYEARKARKGIGMVFQNFSLLERLNVYENVALPMECWGYRKGEVEERVRELLQLVGLEDKLRSYPAQLSGGQKQRVAIARALTMRPGILLCDEATSALDPKTADSILSLLRQINQTTGITVVVVAHQLEVIRKICSHMAILEGGRVADVGETARIFMEHPPALRNLCGESEARIPGGREANFYVALEGEEVGQAVFSQLARETEAEFLILDLQRSSIGDMPMLYYQLYLPPQARERCTEWFRSRGITCRSIETTLEGGAGNV